MGIKGLAKLLSDEAPDCIREVELKSLHGRKIAIDASMAIYQFLIAVRSNGGGSSNNYAATMLTNENGETTSHIQGMFNRTIRFLTEGIKPVFVFDGKPPTIKSHELIKRREKRIKAQLELKKATEDGNIEEQEKQSKRLVRAGQKENLDCQKLLQLMGVPIIIAPCEAEAQAATLCKNKYVYATGTEDMDALTFKTPILVRKMTFANQSKSTIQTMNYNKAIEGLELESHDQFIDLCIMLGCDYCDTIRGVGPKTALKLIKQYKSIEIILQNIDRNRYTIPDSWIPPTERTTTNNNNNTTKKNNNNKSKNKISSSDDKDKENQLNGADNDNNNKNNNNNDDDDDSQNTTDKEDHDDDIIEKNKKKNTDKEQQKEENKNENKKEDNNNNNKDEENKDENEENENNDENKNEENNENNDENEEIEEFIPAYKQARYLFQHHEVIEQVDLKWKPPQENELTKFLVDDMGFNPERVQSNIEKLQKAHKANQKPQARMDSFFSIVKKPNDANSAKKRKLKLQKEKAAAAAAKKKKGSSSSGFRRR